MTEKLTAKLSDGTSGELVHTASMGKEKLYKFVTFKPSPPKELWVNVYKDEPRDGVETSTFQDKQSALNAARHDHTTHRYILAPEPEPQPKPAREWWLVYVNLLGRLVVFDSKKKAHETYPLHKVVHVREVVK